MRHLCCILAFTSVLVSSSAFADTRDLNTDRPGGDYKNIPVDAQPAEACENACVRDALCSELGLDDLIARMPGGLAQPVGETGWQLSHGEKSRIFLARALLQDAQLTILDESFAALDPETLQKCLNCAQRRARTLMVIAHP